MDLLLVTSSNSSETARLHYQIIMGGRVLLPKVEANEYQHEIIICQCVQTSLAVHLDGNEDTGGTLVVDEFLGRSLQTMQT